MKIAAAAFMLILLFAKGCTDSEVKKESKNISFEYEAHTRGSYKKVLAKQDTVFTIASRNGKPVQKKLSEKDWNALLAIASKVDAEKLKDLKAPSEKRFHDGAMIATLKVIYKDKTYESAAFDHGNPPAEIKDLVNKILQVSDLEKQ
ncbi:MAG TPA: hypothetical protein VFR70_07260 [Flavobacterium sp.]|nr:hypothetical protein [Flavobacterium sp.]